MRTARLAPIASLAVLLAACATNRPATSPAPSVAVKIENHTPCETRVHVLEGLRPLITYRVAAQETMTAALKPVASHSLRFDAEPIACGVAPYTVGTVEDPDAIVVTISSAPTLSKVRAVTP